MKIGPAGLRDPEVGRRAKQKAGSCPLRSLVNGGNSSREQTHTLGYIDLLRSSRKRESKRLRRSKEDSIPFEHIVHHQKTNFNNDIVVVVVVVRSDGRAAHAPAAPPASSSAPSAAAAAAARAADRCCLRRR